MTCKRSSYVSAKLYSVFCILLCLSMILVGCGTGAALSQEDYLASMKAFTLPNSTASIYLENSWSTEDAGLDNLLIAGTDSGNTAAFMFQFPKNGMFQVNSIADAKALINQSYAVSDEKIIDAFVIPGMTGIESYSCKMTSDGVTSKACVVYGETEYAYYALCYISSIWKDSCIDSFRASCSKFEENAPEVEDWTTAEVSDTIRWFNASYAVLTALNGWDYNRFGGLPANEDSKAMEIELLDEWWGVTDRTSADETLQWILEEGHTYDFADTALYLQEIGMGDAADRKAFLLENFDITEEEAAAYVAQYAMFEQYGENAILGWDLCRAMNLLGFYYIAGYYTETEALDASLAIAQAMQPLFSSWDDLVASYMRGYEYWAEENSAERQALYEDLKTRSDNPYAIDYNTTLTKTW